MCFTGRLCTELILRLPWLRERVVVVATPGGASPAPTNCAGFIPLKWGAAVLRPYTILLPTRGAEELDERRFPTPPPPFFRKDVKINGLQAHGA
jgi:hypothetical protein